MLGRRRLVVALTVVAAPMFLWGCGDDDTGSASEAMEHDEPSPVPDRARRVAVTARSFAFEPDLISARSGEALAMALAAEDAEHDFVIDELDAHVPADAGETAVGGFRAHAPGRYVFYCSVAGHREAGMEGTLVVEAHE